LKSELDRQQNSKRCTFETEGWRHPEEGKEAFRYRVIIRAGGSKIYWNDEQIDWSEFLKYLSRWGDFEEPPLLIFDASGNNCAFESKIQRTIHDKIGCKSGRDCGFGTDEQWRKAPPLKLKFGVE
jgi:hypothetical protein